MKTFYATTPIYYVNDLPHIGHIYSTVVADAATRYHRLVGEKTRFLTGTDEHGQNIEKAAAAQGIPPIALADRVVARYHDLWRNFDISHDEIKTKALTTLKLQKEIVADFLKLNGERKAVFVSPASKPPEPTPQNGQPVFARMLDIGMIYGKWGKRLLINFEVNGRRCVLFGSANQLAAHIVAAGYEFEPENIEVGLRLNLACRVTTKPTDDGKYLNVDKVLPVGTKVPRGGNHEFASR